MKLDKIEPLVKLGIKLQRCDDQQAVFSLPLIGNRNDKATMFAGSQYSALVVAGWYLVGYWAELNGLGDRVAIKDGQVSYPKAAESDLTVCARFEQPPEIRPSGHWRVLVSVEASDAEGELVSRFTADYRILQ